MKNIFLTLTAALFLAATARAVVIDGHVYLSGQSGHANTKVLFRAVSPSAQSDSAYSDSAGSYRIDLHPGVYNVEYTHSGFARYPLTNQPLLFATTLPDVTLMPPLSGALSGTLGPGDFQVVDSIRVDSGQSLTIVTGTRLYFEPRLTFTIYGNLNAVGTEADSIRFTKLFSSPDSAWGGMQFLAADSNCMMAYCVVELSKGSYYAYQEGEYYGGGLFLYQGAVEIRNCSIHNTSTSGTYGYYGGGIASVRSNVHISECEIAGNYSGAGGGLYLLGPGVLDLRNSHISNNIGWQYGGGVLCTDVTGIISNCLFESNSAYSGLALSCGSNGSFYVTACTFRNNGGPGVIVEIGGTVILEKCLAYHNEGPGIFGLGSGSPTISNCTIADNVGNGVGVYHSNGIITSTIIANSSSGFGLSFGESSNVQVAYCDISGNDSGAVGFYYGNHTYGPPAIGIIALTNTNGDSCDTYYNIYRDPLFADTASGDYHLTAGSPCIDAGDPSLPDDPDGSVADMGAFPYDQRLNAVRPFILHPSSFILSAFPNPFNPVAHIAFDLPRAMDVTLKVYDITGRLAATLLSGKIAEGRHEVAFDGSQLASGVYFARLETGRQAHTHKLVLLK